MDLPKKQIDDYVGPPLVFSGSALAGASALAARTAPHAAHQAHPLRGSPVI
jgi:hypothetical protein